jgi:hypothetical protein
VQKRANLLHRYHLIGHAFSNKALPVKNAIDNSRLSGKLCAVLSGQATASGKLWTEISQIPLALTGKLWAEIVVKYALK